jgi:hypothetical protein
MLRFKRVGVAVVAAVALATVGVGSAFGGETESPG